MNTGNVKDVLSIVVTHNRLKLLQRCIAHLQQQTVPHDILIINNQSTDGTEEYLKANNIDHVTQENSGSAGGWSRALKEGWSRGYRYIWMMDDDGFPDFRALDILLKSFTRSMICVSSVVVKENAREELVFGLPKLTSQGAPVIFSKKRKYNTLKDFEEGTEKYPHLHPFNGVLIDLEKIKPIGNVDTSFFMYGDELDFFYRMKKEGETFTILNAYHYHPDVGKRSIDKKKVYYFIRNGIILNHLYFDKPYLRDFFTIGVAMYRILKRNGIHEFFSYFFGNNSKYFYPAISDGYKKRKIVRYT